MRRDNCSLDSGLHEREKTVAQLTTRVAVLEQEIKDKEQVTCWAYPESMHVHVYIIPVQWNLRQGLSE